MSAPGLREVDVAEECPTIRHRFLLTEEDSDEARPVLIVAFEGQYREGSDGNPDADYMRGQIDLACGLWWSHHGLVIDLSRLAYQYGDAILGALDHPHGRPCAVVVGPDCAGALGTLMNDESPESPVTDLDDVFDDLAAAIAHVRERAASGA